MLKHGFSKRSALVKGLLCLIGASVLFVGFQNCSPQAGFEAVNSATGKLEFSSFEGLSCNVGEIYSCEILNGVGQQTCAEGGVITQCMAISCDSGYQIANGVCEQIPIPMPKQPVAEEPKCVWSGPAAFGPALPVYAYDPQGACPEQGARTSFRMLQGISPYTVDRDKAQWVEGKGERYCTCF